MSYRYCIRLSGAGGQGLIQAARIMAEAAAVYDDIFAAESCSYGPEARGNSCRAEVIISDRAIIYPKVDELDLLLALTQESYDKYIGDLKPGGILIVEENLKIEDDVKNVATYRAPFTVIAESQCGKTALVNIVVLGFLSHIITFLDSRSILQSMLARVPKLSETAYLKAYECGKNTAGKFNSSIK